MFALQYYTVSKTFFFVLNINTDVALLRNNKVAAVASNSFETPSLWWAETN